MTFASPWRLVALVAVAALVVGYLVVQRQRRSYTVRFTNVDLLASVAPRRPGWRRHVPAGLFVAALAAMVVAWAGPQASRDMPVERATVVLAIDVSLSMQATDVAPNRLEAAQQAALDFIEVVPDQINVGLVTFSGVATIAVPPTTDRLVLASAIERLELAERTAIGEAIFASLDAIELAPGGSGPRGGGANGADDANQEQAVPSAIVLMSDGATTAGRPDEQAVAAANAAGVPVTTIAFGTDAGTISLPDEPFPIPVPVDRAALEAIASATGGAYFAADTASELERIYTDLGSSIGVVTRLEPLTSWFVGAAVVVLFATATLSLLWYSRLP